MKLALATCVTTAIAIMTLPGHTSVVVRIGLLTVASVGMVGTLVALREALPGTPSAFAAALTVSPPGPVRPGSLTRLEREVSMAAETAFDLRARLTPTLRDLAAGLLRDRRGVELSRDSARAEALLGPVTWAIVRPDAEPVRDRTMPGISTIELEAVIASLEEL